MENHLGKRSRPNVIHMFESRGVGVAGWVGGWVGGERSTKGWPLASYFSGKGTSSRWAALFFFRWAGSHDLQQGTEYVTFSYCAHPDLVSRRRGELMRLRCRPKLRLLMNVSSCIVLDDLSRVGGARRGGLLRIRIWYGHSVDGNPVTNVLNSALAKGSVTSLLHYLAKVK